MVVISLHNWNQRIKRDKIFCDEEKVTLLSCLNCKPETKVTPCACVNRSCLNTYFVRALQTEYHNRSVISRWCLSEINDPRALRLLSVLLMPAGLTEKVFLSPQMPIKNYLFQCRIYVPHNFVIVESDNRLFKKIGDFRLYPVKVWKWGLNGEFPTSGIDKFRTQVIQTATNPSLGFQVYGFLRRSCDSPRSVFFWTWGHGQLVPVSYRYLDRHMTWVVKESHLGKPGTDKRKEFSKR